MTGKTVLMKKILLRGLLPIAAVLLSTGCEIEKPSGKGSISIKSNPDRAEVFINSAPQGTTPIAIPGLQSGDYIVELRKEGYERTYNSVSLLVGQEVELDLQMNKETGLLLVESNPRGADVLIDGVSKGTTPLLLTDLPLGKYTLEFRSLTQLPRTMEAELTGRTPVHVFAELISNTAQLTVSSEPEGAEVRINGILVGQAPVTIEEVQAGESDVKISKRGYKPHVQHMLFEATKPYKINAQLEALPSGLTVLSDPEGARIMIDNVPVGEAPVTVSNLKEGPHEISATLNGYATKVKTIYLEPDINDSVEFNMVKNSGTLVIDTEPANVQIYVDGTLLTTTQPKGGSDSISQPVRITLKSGVDHNIQLVRDGFVSLNTMIQTEVDQVVTRHEVLKRIFVYDTKIITDNEIIKCRIEYRLPNGNIYYERYPGVFNTAKAADIRDVQPITLDDESNRQARRLIEMNREAVPVE
jgi:archaellum component FlaG (FlaF/FlaG flagellin family)